MSYLLAYLALLIALSRPPDMVGKATYYHECFQGRLTRNEEVFDQEKLTAAVDDAMWAKLEGKEVIVCESSPVRLELSKCVILRVNDTGYLAKWDVEVDLSKRAFTQLAPLRQGVVRVKVWIITG